MSNFLEHDYIGLTEPLERNPEKVSNNNEMNRDSCMNLKETELRLGLPGSQSTERKIATKTIAPLRVSLFGNNGSSLGSLKSPVSGAKRGYYDALNGSSSKWSPVKTVENNNSSQHACDSATIKKDAVASSTKSIPSSKAQVVGWPPIGSHRKNSMSSNMAKSNGDSESKTSEECLYVKVSMDGAPYLRKVDLKMYKNYMELSEGLEKMFSCFTIGQSSSNVFPGRDRLSESRLMDLLSVSDSSEYVISYEDKDGDWMLVGDVPWEMFTDSCRRLRMMKSSKAIGLAPRALERCKTSN